MDNIIINDNFRGIRAGIIGVLILFSFYGLICLFYKDDYAKEIDYYENGIKVEAIEYHNEIYLKKGE